MRSHSFVLLKTQQERLLSDFWLIFAFITFATPEKHMGLKSRTTLTKKVFCQFHWNGIAGVTGTLRDSLTKVNLA